MLKLARRGFSGPSPISGALGRVADVHGAPALAMRRALLGLLALALVGGCGSESTTKQASKFELARECVAYQHSYWRGVGESAERAPDPDWQQYACATVYSKPSCPEAWMAGEGAQTAALAKACPAAYCGALGNKPTLCRRGPETLKKVDLVRALVELDTAILTLELSDRGLAQQLAARFRVVRTTVLVPQASGAASAAAGARTKAMLVGPSDAGTQAAPRPGFVVSVDAKGEILLGAVAVSFAGLPEELRKRRKASPASSVPEPVTLRVDEAVPYRRIVEIMDALVSAGFSQVSLSK